MQELTIAIQWTLLMLVAHITSINYNTKVPISGNTGNADNKGYFIFIRGDRNPATVANPASNPPINNTTLSCTGRLQTGDQLFSSSAGKVSATANGYSLIGNPYASPRDLSKLAGDIGGGTPSESSGLNNIVKPVLCMER
ncbi:MAG: hypothetical protein WDM71_05920 [Ferruginibacter sp.]